MLFRSATGNWIKVVQRVPVRIALDANELAGHPLRVGLSMNAKVDVSKTDGRMLADASRAPAATQTNVFDQNHTAADAEVRKIIVANGGRAGGPAGGPAAGRAGNRVDLASGTKNAAGTPGANAATRAAALPSAAAASVATLAARSAPAATQLK